MPLTKDRGTKREKRDMSFVGIKATGAHRFLVREESVERGLSGCCKNSWEFKRRHRTKKRIQSLACTAGRAMECTYRRNDQKDMPLKGEGDGGALDKSGLESLP